MLSNISPTASAVANASYEIAIELGLQYVTAGFARGNAHGCQFGTFTGGTVGIDTGISFAHAGMARFIYDSSPSEPENSVLMSRNPLPCL